MSIYIYVFTPEKRKKKRFSIFKQVGKFYETTNRAADIYGDAHYIQLI